MFLYTLYLVLQIHQLIIQIFYNCQRVNKLPKEINTEGGCRGMFERCETVTHAGPYDLSPSLDKTNIIVATV